LVTILKDKLSNNLKIKKMAKESLNRLHPLIKFTCNGNIILEFIEEIILADIIDSNRIEKLRPGDKIVLDETNYEIDKIIVEYSNFMHGDYGIPMNYIGESDNFNTVINILLK
jgi:hypothetical protein